jgi:hypothetical protein
MCRRLAGYRLGGGLTCSARPAPRPGALARRQVQVGHWTQALMPAGLDPAVAGCVPIVPAGEKRPFPHPVSPCRPFVATAQWCVGMGGRIREVLGVGIRGRGRIDWGQPTPPPNLPLEGEEWLRDCGTIPPKPPHGSSPCQGEARWGCAEAASAAGSSGRVRAPQCAGLPVQIVSPSLRPNWRFPHDRSVRFPDH